MQVIDVNIILHLIRLKIESDKEHIRHYFLFCEKKSATVAHRIICETCNENVSL